MKQHIPNLLTLGNLAAGVAIIILSFETEPRFHLIGILAVVAMVFDFLDGTAARALHVTSEMGKELDSLSDMVSFGVAPGLVLYNFLMKSPQDLSVFLLVLPLLIPLFSAYRLAKFNSTSQSPEYFQGLPTPAFAFACYALPLAADQAPWIASIVQHPVLLVLFVVVGCMLLISNVKLLSFKLGSKHKQINRIRIVILVLGLALLIGLKFFGVILCLLMYIVLSLTAQKHFS